MRDLLKGAIDWTSIKLNLICTAGFLSDDILLNGLAGIGTLSTIVYNGIQIYKTLKNKK